jgi:hypothetical protein
MIKNYEDFINESENTINDLNILEESFTDKKLAEEIKKHGGLNKDMKDCDARMKANFDLQNSKYKSYLSYEIRKEITDSDCFDLLYNSIHSILYTNDGGIILLSHNGYDDDYKKWSKKIKTRNNNWRPNGFQQNPDYFFEEPFDSNTYLRRKKI